MGLRSLLSRLLRKRMKASTWIRGMVDEVFRDRSDLTGRGMRLIPWVPWFREGSADRFAQEFAFFRLWCLRQFVMTHSEFRVLEAPSETLEEIVAHLLSQGLPGDQGKAFREDWASWSRDIERVWSAKHTVNSVVDKVANRCTIVGFSAGEKMPPEVEEQYAGTVAFLLDYHGKESKVYEGVLRRCVLTGG